MHFSNSILFYYQMPMYSLISINVVLTLSINILISHIILKNSSTLTHMKNISWWVLNNWNHFHWLYMCLNVLFFHNAYQGKSEGFDNCDRPSNLNQIGFKS